MQLGASPNGAQGSPSRAVGSGVPEMFDPIPFLTSKRVGEREPGARSAGGSTIKDGPIRAGNSARAKRGLLCKKNRLRTR